MSITVTIDAHVEEMDDGTQITWPAATLSALPGDLILANSGSDLTYAPWNPVNDSRFAASTLVFSSGVDWTTNPPTVGASPYVAVSASGIDLSDEELGEVEEIASIDLILDTETEVYPLRSHGGHTHQHGGHIYPKAVGRRHKHRSDPTLSTFACVFKTSGGSTSSASFAVAPFGGGVPYYTRDDGAIIALSGGGTVIKIHDTAWPAPATVGGRTSNGVQGAIVCFSPDTTGWAALPFYWDISKPGNPYAGTDYYTWIKVGTMGWDADTVTGQLPFFSYYDATSELQGLHINTAFSASLIVAANSLVKGLFPISGLAASDIITLGTITKGLFRFGGYSASDVITTNTLVKGLFPTAGLAASDIITLGTINKGLFGMTGLLPVVGPAESLWHTGGGGDVNWHHRLFNAANEDFQGHLSGGNMSGFDSFGTNEQLEWRGYDGVSVSTTLSTTAGAGTITLNAGSTASIMVGQDVTLNPGGGNQEILTVSFIGDATHFDVHGGTANTHTAGETIQFSQWTAWKRLHSYNFNLDGQAIGASNGLPGISLTPGVGGAYDIYTPTGNQRYYVHQFNLLTDGTADVSYCYGTISTSLDNGIQFRVTYTHQ